MSRSLPPFIKGIELCERFYREAVRPLLDQYFPAVKHSAAKLDSGSEVLGFDTAQSRDHHWGPKVMIFVDEQNYDPLHAKISKVMSEKLPFTFAGYPTHFVNPHVSGGIMQFTDQRPLNHGVTIHTFGSFFKHYLDINPEYSIDEKQWLTLSQQCLCTVVRGRIFHDGLGRLRKIQEKLRWYPRDVWIYLLACQWVRLDQEEPFTARCGDVGDELGSRIVASRQVVELMRLCLLMEKRYWPYNKWFGSAFSQLECSAALSVFPQVRYTQRGTIGKTFRAIGWVLLARIFLQGLEEDRPIPSSCMEVVCIQLDSTTTVPERYLAIG